MSEDVLICMFWLGTVSVLPFWILVIFFPHWSVTQRITRSPLLLAPPALIHTALAVMLLATRPDLKDDYSALFPLAPGRILVKMAEPDMATVSWLHMLPGDLFIGWWIYLDGRERGLGPWIVSPALLVTCISGSIGFVLYLLARTLQDVVNRIHPRIEP